jgi:hypothetical protein
MIFPFWDFGTTNDSVSVSIELEGSDRLPVKFPNPT